MARNFTLLFSSSSDLPCTKRKLDLINHFFQEIQHPRLPEKVYDLISGIYEIISAHDALYRVSFLLMRYTIPIFFTYVKQLKMQRCKKCCIFEN